MSQIRNVAVIGAGTMGSGIASHLANAHEIGVRRDVGKSGTGCAGHSARFCRGAAVIVPFFCLISLVFLATTYDSASYALASSASMSLAGDRPPARWHRLFWAFMLALLPTALLVGDSGSGRLRSLQTASLIVSVPLFLIFVVMAISLVTAIKKDEAKRNNEH